jgi:hypothetical protein
MRNAQCICPMSYALYDKQQAVTRRYTRRPSCLKRISNSGRCCKAQTGCKKKRLGIHLFVSATLRLGGIPPCTWLN